MRVLLAPLILLLAACNTLQGPQGEGVPLPTPTIPLAQTGPFLGDKPTDVDALVTKFDKTVFFVEGRGAYPFIHKWAGEIRYTVRPNDKFGDLITRAADRLSPVAGLRIYRSDTFDTANVLVEIGGRGDFCHVDGFARKTDAVYVGAIVKISSDFPAGTIPECIIEEFSQMLGPGNDTTVLEQSLWRPYEQKTYHDLTWSDAVILRALYDERLKPGMHRDKALPIVRQIITELVAELNG